MKDPLQSPKFTLLIRILAVALIALLIFWAGTVVGYRKAAFSYRWDDSYARQFAGERSPLGFFDQDVSDRTPNPHGAFGQVVSVSLPVIVIKGPAEAEKEVVIGSTTVIRSFHDATASTTLMPGNTVVVIGSPNNSGQIEASFIRIMPPPGQPAQPSQP